jgi:hypothetical protein
MDWELTERASLNVSESRKKSPIDATATASQVPNPFQNAPRASAAAAQPHSTNGRIQPAATAAVYRAPTRPRIQTPRFEAAE